MTDTTNGKQYVGQHRYNKEELDPSYHGSGHIIRRIYSKRPETIKEEYLKTCFTQQDMDEWEKYFIFTNNTLHPNGYNLTEGGGGGIPCEETRQKLSDLRKGKHPSEEARRKLIKALRNHVKKSKPVLQYTLDGEFVREWPSTKECGRSGFKQRQVSACCCGKKKSHHGFIWRYKDVTYNEDINYKTAAQQAIERFSKPVLQYTLDGEFVREWPSTAECGRNGFKQASISDCCRGKYKTAYNYVWRYKGVIYDEDINYKTPHQRMAEACSKPVLQYTLDGEFVREWPSTAECGRNGFKQASISRCCRGEKKSHHGYVWRYKGVRYEEEINYKTPSEALSKPVLQYTLNGEFVREWPSANECGRNGFHQSAVSACCRGERKSHHGYIWKYRDEND